MRDCLLALLLASASAPLLAESVYQWTDEDGVVHYSDVPPPSGVDAVVEGLEPIPEVGSVDPQPEAVGDEAADASAAMDAGEEALSPAEQQRRKREEQLAQRRLEQQQTEAMCAAMRQQLAVYEPNPRVLIETEDGEVERLDDDVRLEKVNEARSYLDRNCGGADADDAS